MNAETALLRLCLCMLAVTTSPLRAQSPLTGSWISRELRFANSAPSCVYIESVASSFDLQPGLNRTTSGIFTRTLQRVAWSIDLERKCVLPGKHDARDFMMRFDTWYASGEYIDTARQKFTLTSAGCTGDCGDQLAFAKSFSINLQRAGDGVIGDVVPGVIASTRYQAKFDMTRNEAAATAAFLDLYRPLLEGNCNQFYNNSLDPDGRRKINQNYLCTYARQVAAMTPPVLSSEPTFEFAASLGTINGLMGPISLRPGDVLVRRFLVLDADGSGVPTNAVLRKQSDNSWRIVDMVP